MSMKKIGFCFLCKDGINHLKLWESFFKDNYDKCNIYLHTYEDTDMNELFIKKHHINCKIRSGWGDIYDILQYIMKISIKNGDYKLILLSESTIPLRSFKYIYDYVTYDSKGYLKYTPHIAKTNTDKNTLMRQYHRYIENIKSVKTFINNIDINHWFFHEAWVIFNNEMMELIINDKKYIHIFRDCFCPDENYVMFLLSLSEKLDIFHNIKTTYVNWNESLKENNRIHPKMYYKITERDLNKMMNPNYLFARKFDKDSDICDYIPFDDTRIITNRCKEIFTEVKKKIKLPENTLFTYLRDITINYIPIYQDIYQLLNDVNILNNKKTLGLLLNDTLISSRVYTNVSDILKTGSNENKLWFIKYIHGSCGMNMICKRTSDLRILQISDKFIIQEGITDLDLHDGYKYTLRIFVLIHDKKLYLYRGIKKRVHCKKYDVNSTEYNIHISGGSYKDRIPHYYEDKDRVFCNIKKNLLELKKHIESFINKTDKHLYILLGIDYVVTTDKNVILIEINTLPNLVNTVEMNAEINIPLIEDSIHLIIWGKLNNYCIL
jgi:hypothetical protein